ncbi:MAG: hypothetical protein KC646_00585 [Candidatus Cloacimonetes bacterium]|nr:hypothetical protein [Candidatus Cloacimonadota bacterium]
MSAWFEKLPQSMRPINNIGALRELSRLYTSPNIVELFDKISSLDSIPLPLWESAIIDYFNLWETQKGYTSMSSFFQADSLSRIKFLNILSKSFYDEYILVSKTTTEYFINEMIQSFNKDPAP